MPTSLSNTFFFNGPSAIATILLTLLSTTSVEGNETKLESTAQALSASANHPMLTGRWGENLFPSQLVYEYPGYPTNTEVGRTITPARKSTVLVIVSMTSRCPVARRAIPVLNKLQQDNHHQGVEIIGLFTDQTEDVRSMATFAVETDIHFPVYLDDQRQLNDPDQNGSWATTELEMTVTSEAVVMDVRDGWANRRIIYRGMIDESLRITSHRVVSRGNYLQQAIDSLFSSSDSSELDLLSVAPQGCKIEPIRKRNINERVDYYPTIATIVQNKCVRCHREGELGAESFMAFESYDDFASIASTALDRIQSRMMPPWTAQVPADGEQEVGHLLDDLTLSDEELRAFRDWYEGGMTKGDPNLAPTSIEWPPSNDWKIGTPDLVLTMPEPFEIPISRWEGYRYYYLDTGFSHERFVRAVELKPGNKNVVHHMGALLGPAPDKPLQGTEAMIHFYGLTGDRVKKLGDWVPGGGKFNALSYSNDEGIRIPANHGIVLEMHYTPTGRPEPADQSSIGLIFCDEPPKTEIMTAVENKKRIHVPAHSTHTKISDRYWFKNDVTIQAIGPHMHFRGKDYTLFKVTDPSTPDEKRTPILQVFAYDIRWQRTYEFKKPLYLKAGDYLEAVAHFDNSHFNPNNPDPTEPVEFGLQSEAEMFNTRFRYTIVPTSPDSTALGE